METKDKAQEAAERKYHSPGDGKFYAYKNGYVEGYEAAVKELKPEKEVFDNGPGLGNNFK